MLSAVVPRRVHWPALLGVLIVAAYAVALAILMRSRSFDYWGALIVFPLLLVVSLPVLRRTTTQWREPELYRFLVAALIVKLLCSVARWWMSFRFYDAVADAAAYDLAGRHIAETLRSGVLTVDIGKPVVGTGFLEILTGTVYSVIGPTLLGGYLVYSWLGFWGLFFFYKAFRLGFPDGDHRRYALLLFFLPSLLFWPSGIGKDTWLLFTLGLMAYGAALLFTRTRGAVLFLGLGGLGSLMVRPHVTVLFFAGVCLGYLLRRRTRTALGPVRTLIGIGVLTSVSILLLGQVTAFLGLENVNAESVNDTLSDVQRNTSQGGSERAVDEPSLSPLGLPMAVVSVLFRPFPFEANSVQTLIAALEGAFLMVLFVVSRHRLRRSVKYLRRSPYLACLLVYALLFCLAFANFANFGILTRERVMVFPTALAFLAVPLAADWRSRRQRAADSIASTTSPHFAKPT
jgi:hypothetical protein